MSLKIPLTAVRHKDSRSSYGIILHISGHLNLINNPVAQQFYGYRGDNLVLTIQIPDDVDTLLGISDSQLFSGTDWKGRCWIGKASKHGIRIYMGKGAPSARLVPGKAYEATVLKCRSVMMDDDVAVDTPHSSFALEIPL